MDILLCLNDCYAIPCGVLMTSICLTNSDECVTFHLVVAADFSDDNRYKLIGIADRFGKSCIFYMLPCETILKIPKVKAYQGQETFFRLFACDVLPREMSKILYLDADMLVLGSLHDLWETDVSGYSTGVVWDYQWCDDILIHNRFGLEHGSIDGYVNTGLLLINLDWWRRERTGEKALQAWFDNERTFECVDQDALNFILRDSRFILPLRYNVITLLKVESLRIRWQCHEELTQAQEEPVIVHFITPIKPWHRECRHPYKCVWEAVYRLTPWKDVKARRKKGVGETLSAYLKSVVSVVVGARILEFFGLKKNMSWNERAMVRAGQHFESFTRHENLY